MSEAPEKLVLLVLSDDELRGRVGALIKSYGFRVVEANDSESALERARGTPPDVAIVSRLHVTDDLRWIRGLKTAVAGTGIPLILCGLGRGEEREQEQRAGRAAGADDYIQKGFHPDELLARLRMLTSVAQAPDAYRSGVVRALQNDAVGAVKELSDGTRSRSRASLDREQAVVDANTNLPQTTALFREIKGIIDYTGQMTILYVRCPNNPLIEETFGWETASGVLRDIADAINEILPDLCAEQGRGLVAYGGGDDFVIFLGGERGELAELLDSRHAVLLARRISSVIMEKWSPEVAEIFDVTIGSASVRLNPRVHIERLIFRGIYAARAETDERVRTGHQRKVELLRRCIRERALHLLFQPIVSSENDIMGYEALTRGRIAGLENPQILFDVAQSVGMVWDISREVRRLAFRELVSLPEGKLLFVNLHPIDFGDPHLARLEAPAPIGDATDSAASRVVFEITERAAIDDFDRFRASIAPLRSLGYRIAVDDLGSGYAGLNSIANIEPNFIKFDMSLIRDIDQNPLRQNLIRTFVKFAESIPSKVIAEGVETENERNCLIDLGCHFLQGYYFARPGPPFPRVGVR